MKGAISEPRKELSKYAPKFESFYIDKDKIKDVIGSGGKVINEIIEKCNQVKIDIEDDGKVTIYHTDKDSILKAKDIIEGITREVEVGEIFDGVITRVEEYGVFVSLFGDKEGLCHVSKLSNEYLNSAKDFARVGEKIKVKVIDVDNAGKIKLSHKEFTPKAKKKETSKEVKEETKKKSLFRKKSK